jgi:hypothetical protein
VICVLPATKLIAGATGLVAGVTVIGSDAVPSPISFFAFIRIVYSVPLVKPVIVIGVVVLAADVYDR